MTSNIDSLIKDFFHNPPSFKSAINLSWKFELNQQVISFKINKSLKLINVFFKNKESK